MNEDRTRIAIVFGASRGIGAAIAIALGNSGYNVTIAAKSTESNRQLDPSDPRSGTIYTVAEKATSARTTALPVPWDARTGLAGSERVVQRAVERYGPGCLDLVVYAAGALSWLSVSETAEKKFDLLNDVNARGCFSVVKACLPHLRPGQSAMDGNQKKELLGGGKIVVIAPPIYSRFVRGKTVYAMTKIAMSVLVLGLATEFSEESGNAVCAMWPATAEESAATETLFRANEGDGNSSTSSSSSSKTKTKEKKEFLREDLRSPKIFADAVIAVASTPNARSVNGRFLVDEDYLREIGVTDFRKYQLVPGKEPPRMLPKIFPSLDVQEQNEELFPRGMLNAGRNQMRRKHRL